MVDKSARICYNVYIMQTMKHDFWRYYKKEVMIMLKKHLYPCVIAASVITVSAVCLMNTPLSTDRYIPAQITASAAEVSGDFEFEKDTDSDGSEYCIITKYNGSSTDLKIPSSFTLDDQTLPLKKISRGAFQNCTTLKSVTIPEGVTEIGYEAFRGCTNLADVSFPTTLTTMDSYAFSGCPIKSLLVNSELSSEIRSSFDSDTLESITFGSNTTVIPSRMCEGMESLKSITFSNSITEIGDSAFERCTSLTKIVLPDSVKKIGDYAFYGTGLTYADLGNGVETIGDEAFYAYPNGVPISTLKLGNSLREIGKDAFCKISISGTLKLPDSLENIGYGAFSYCDGITSLELGSGTKVIGDYAFSSCSNLLKAKMNTGLTEIGKNAFGATGLIGKLTIPSGVKKIGEYAFAGTEITSVTFPETLEEIDAYAFTALALTRVELPDSVTTLGGAVFYECRNMKYVKLPANIEYIPTSCFEKCGIESLIIPNKVKTIAPTAFNNCSGLTNVTFGESLETIEDHAFQFTNISYLKFPDSLKKIGDNAFYEVDGLKKIENWSESLESVGTFAFGGCGSLAEIPPIPAQFQTIPDSLFSGCLSLSHVEIEDGITQIGNDAFSECALTEITIPDSVEFVLSGAFAYNKLQEIMIGSGVTDIGNRTFVNNPAKNIYVPKNVETLGSQSIGIEVGGYESSTIEGFTLYGNSETAKSYASDNGLTYKTANGKQDLPSQTEYVDPATGIHAFAESGLTMKIVKLDSVEAVNSYLSERYNWGTDWATNIINEKETFLCGYDILWYKNGSLYCPDYEIKLHIPISQEYQNGSLFSVYGNIYYDSYRMQWYGTNSNVYRESNTLIGYIKPNLEEQNPLILKAQLTVVGDVNMDGTLNIADVVSLQRYLLNCGSLNNWKAGDLHSDGKLNALDLSLLKKKILETYTD